jgi:hypothetical protein
LPEIEWLICDCATTHSGHVFAGDRLAFDYFSTKLLNLPEKPMLPLASRFISVVSRSRY